VTTPEASATYQREPLYGGSVLIRAFESRGRQVPQALRRDVVLSRQGRHSTLHFPREGVIRLTGWPTHAIVQRNSVGATWRPGVD
jgi:hypothetical protein